jgi:RND family efflux transporter MFP subunit
MLSGCGDSSQAPAPPPVPVDIIFVKAEAVPNIVELPGRIAAVRSAEVRARTDGIVQRRLYEEGSDVAAGAPLFLIDQRDNRAQVQSAEAALQRAIAAKENAASIVNRYQPLMSERAVSAQEYDAARSELRQAEAQVSEARAALARSQLLLSYTTVRAPIAGRVGRAEVTEGALVTGAEGTLMTRVDQVTPAYAVFAESNASILNTIQQVRSGDLKLPSLARVEVRLVLENGATYVPVGHLDFTSSVVDPETGSQTVRALFDNPQQLLVPGQFVRGRIEAGMLDNGIVVPARAVQIKGEDASVSILGKDDMVTNRAVTLGALVGKGWIITSGLKPGERVIVDGWQKVRPGQKAQVRAAGSQKPASPQQGR